jgi:hypothetical protein
MLDGPVPPAIVLLATLALMALRRLPRFRESHAADAAILAAIVALTGMLELAMGRTPTYRHGPVRVWSGNINSDENSQQITDPYTFTHVVHGAVFYGVTRIVLGSQPVVVRAVVTIALESAWESYENTEQVINRYRAETIALGYYGDSVINSVFDIIACGVGFVLAWKLPARATVAWVAAVEIALALTIRDNLTLNVLMLLHPVAAIRRWQMGA